MPDSNHFLAAPLWKFFKRIPRWKTGLRFLRLPHVRKALAICAGFIAIYLVISVTGALLIYRSGTENGFTRFAERLFPYPAAIVNGEVISLSRFRREVSAREHYASVHEIASNHEETQRFVRQLLITRTLFSQSLEKNKMELDPTQLQDRRNEIYEEVGGEEKMEQFIRENWGESVSLTLFNQWLKEVAIENAVQDKLLTQVTVRHILIGVPENATPEQIEAARVKAVEVRALITPDLSNFGEVARNESQDIASRDNGGSFGTTNRGDDSPVLSADFENTLFSLPIGTLSEPVQSPHGWHLLIVDSKTGSIDMSKKAYAEQLRKDAKVRIFVGKDA